MKKSVFIFGLIISFFANHLYAQEQKDLEERYLEYFKLPRETLYLHTNKTIYLTNEDIWFKTYAYDRKNELSSKTTTNIYFGLYDKKGTEIAKKLYLARKGAAIGNFALDSTVPSGEYFLKVSTNWMKNFKEDDSYVQKIQIINPKYPDRVAKKINKVEYDFQFLPEGGHILSDVKNNIGIKAIDDYGKGIASSGIILNSNNEEVASFKSNALGIGKFSFIPKKGEKYTAQVSLDNAKEFKQELPEMQEIGVALLVNNSRKDKTIVTLHVNQKSFDFFKGKVFKLLLHKDGKVKSIPFLFENTSKQIVLSSSDLYQGVNTITLFNWKSQPVVERMFFNNSVTIRNDSFFLSQTEKEGDSIIYKIRTNSNLGDVVLNASISVLPGETKSYNPDYNIISAIHLKPYLKGLVENPQYYFKNFDRKKQFELDALLLTQGWARYTWDHIINFPPKPSFDFENGISVNGFVNENLEKVSSFFLYPTKFNKSKFVKMDNEGKFHLKNFYPQAYEEIRFSYLDKQGAMKKPKMSLSYIKFMDVDNVNTSIYQSFMSYYQDKNDIEEEFIIDDSYEELDEIRLKTDYKRKLWRESQDPLLVNGKVTRITEEEINRYPNITDLINDKGFDVIVWQGPSVKHENGIRILTGDVLITSRRLNRDREDGVPDKPTVFLDGARLNNFNVLLNMNTDKVEKVVIDKTGVGLGSTAGFGGAIKITTRRNVYTRNDNNVNTTLFSNISDYGFQPIKKFYTPKYASYRIQSFKDYGVIHWEPNLNIYGDTSNDLKIFDARLDEIKIYIEGIGSDGNVFSQIITIDNTAKN